MKKSWVRNIRKMTKQLNNSSENKIPAIPFPGINPFGYEYRDIFFARKDETRTLIQQISMYRAVMLYADSGTGKSSLINAGLIPHAIKEGYQPEYIRIQPKKDEEFIVKRISKESEDKKDFLPTIFTPNEDQKHVLKANTINDYVQDINKLQNNPQLAFQLVQNARKYLEIHDLNNSIKEIAKLYEKLLSSH